MYLHVSQGKAAGPLQRDVKLVKKENAEHEMILLMTMPLSRE